MIALRAFYKRRLMKNYSFISNWRHLIIALACAFSCACANISTIQSPTSENKLANYKRAYIEALANDEWQLNQALLFELTDMGIEIVGIPFKHPTENDLLVKYSFDSGWDLTKYLKAFQFQFIDALSGRIVASTSYQSTGIWLGKRDGRLKSAINDLREKNGYPPTKQFE